MKNIITLEDMLNHLWASKITKLEFDLLRNLITINVISEDAGKFNNYNVTFFEVSSYYYTKNNGKSRLTDFSYEEGDYLELTSIDYFEDGIGNITIQAPGKDWVNEYNAAANFALEIWSSLLLIEAKSIRINDSYFQDLISYL